ncbi:hypothetical protein BDV06DRAFT_226584 [Aspergillus oleicola]
MHWVTGSWLWARHKSSRSTGTAIYLEHESSSRHNRRRTWSLPARPQTSEGPHSHPSSSTSTSTSTSSVSGDRDRAGLYRVETHSYYPHLRCIRCGGVRSRDYHYRHFDDPVKYPSVGICSRERTRCARAKSDPPPPPAPMVHEFVEVHGRSRRSPPLLDISELPDTSPRIDELETKSLSEPPKLASSWKHLLIAQICLLHFAVYLASSIYIPGEPYLMEECNVSEVVSILALSLFTLGYGVGPMLWSPLSEMPELGQTVIFVRTLLAFILFQLPVSLTRNIAVFLVFLVFRWVTGFCGSLSSETDENDNRQRQLAKPNWIGSAHYTVRDTMILRARALTLTFTEPIVFLMDLYAGFLYGLLFLWFESFPIVFGDMDGFSLGELGLTFLAILVFTVLKPTLPPWLNKSLIPRMNSGSGFTPEMVLPPTFIGALALDYSGLRGYQEEVLLDCADYWLRGVAIAIVTLYNSVYMYIGVIYANYAAPVFARAALFRALLGAAFPLFVGVPEATEWKDEID